MSQNKQEWIVTLPLDKLKRHEVKLSFHGGGPHLEEALAALMIVMEAKFSFWKKYGRGVIRLGHGGGPFDEHGTIGQLPKSGTCCATLVANALGIMKNPARNTLWMRFIRYAYMTDTGKPLDSRQQQAAIEGQSAFDINKLFKLEWRQFCRTRPEGSASATYQGDFETLFVRMIDALRLFVESQRTYLEAETIVFNEGRVVTIALPGKKALRVLFVTSSNFMINAAGRAYRADVVVQRQSSGNINIFTANKSVVDLDDLAKVLNREEMRLAKHRTRLSWSELCQEGMPEGSRWFYFRRTRQLHNGTEHHEVEPTRIPWDSLKELVVLALDESKFEPERQQEVCLQGLCSHKQTPCPLYRFGLKRCQMIRRRDREQAQAAT